jgi:hypothetical protein
MTTKDKIISAIFVVGGVMTLVGALAYATAWREWAPYIYTVGAGMVALAQVNSPVDTENRTLRRLRIQQIFGALALVLAGLFMMYTHGNEWIVCMAIAAVLELYTAFRIPQEIEKEKKQGE